MPAYFGPWRIISRDPVPPNLQALARKLVGGMLETGGIPQRTWHLDDGSTIHALIVNGMPKVTITQVKASSEQEAGNAAMWVPRGFVVYPAWSDATGGVGLPVVASATGGPYDPINTAPGILRARWTPGGPCGEVLVSPDEQAGYPAANLLAVPLLADATKGPLFEWSGQGAYDAREPTGAWTSYRMELAPPVANYADESAAEAAALFEQINTLRAGAGAAALVLPARGNYRPGKVMCSIMQASGSTDATNAGYPTTYATPADRLSKDGYRALRIGKTFSAWARTDNLMGAELRAAGGVSATLAAWDADPVLSPGLIADYGPGATLDTGSRGGYLCATITQRDRWIEAGNQSWQPEDLELPPLSWMGFASLNLAWETFPATYDPGSTTQPIVPAQGFTNARGECWLNYPRSSNPTPSSLEPAMSRHVFCRGRAIGVAPRGGLVWGACIQSVTMADKSVVDRLIVLVHHPEDQGSAIDGPARYLRVWWADLKRRAHLRADPQATLAGEDITDPWAWRGGALVDLGNLPDPSAGFKASAGVNSLKYASQWRFHPRGTHAVCLRDYGAQADYQLASIGNVVSLQSSYARAVELQFYCTDTDVIPRITVHDYAGGQVDTPALRADNRPPLSGDTLLADAGGAAPLYDLGTYPIAVDYDATGAMMYAYAINLMSSNVATDTGFSQHLTYSYLGIGTAAAKRLDDLSLLALVGTSFKTHQDFEGTLQSVLDVRSGAFLSLGMRPRYMVDTAHLTSMAGPSGSFAGLVTPSTATDAPCGLFTALAVNGVRLHRLGGLLEERWYANPDGCLWWPVARCHQAGDGYQVTLPLAVSSNVQGFYAERFNKHVVSYQVSPMPVATLVADTAPSSGSCGCQLTVTALAGGITLHAMTDAELSPRGGGMHASVPLPVCDWLINLKVV